MKSYYQQLVYLIGFIISLSGFCLAIVAASEDKIYHDPNNTEAGLQAYVDQGTRIREYNSISIILIFAGFLIINLRHVYDIAQATKNALQTKTQLKDLTNVITTPTTG